MATIPYLDKMLNNCLKVVLDHPDALDTILERINDGETMVMCETLTRLIERTVRVSEISLPVADGMTCSQNWPRKSFKMPSAAARRQTNPVQPTLVIRKWASQKRTSHVKKIQRGNR